MVQKIGRIVTSMGFLVTRGTSMDLATTGMITHHQLGVTEAKAILLC
jgi:hypothetical protein